MITINGIDINTIEDEYKYKFSLMEGESCKGFQILENLTDMEFRILVLYCEIGSYAQIGEMLDCSASTVGNYIRRIKEKLIRFGLKKEDLYVIDND